MDSLLSQFLKFSYVPSTGKSERELTKFSLNLNLELGFTLTTFHLLSSQFTLFHGYNSGKDLLTMENSQLMQQPNNLKSHGVPSDHGKLKGFFVQILRFAIIIGPDLTQLYSNP